MKILVKILVLLILPSSGTSLAFAQVKSPISQEAGDCAVNITGSGNNASLVCTNLDPKLAEQVRAILTSTQRNEKSTKEISQKLDVILKEIRKQRPTARRIPPDRQAEIVALLALRPAKISIMAVAQNEEAYDFAQDWYNIFKAAGWTMLDEVVRIFITAGRPERGIRLNLHGEPIPPGSRISVSKDTSAGVIIESLQGLKLGPQSHADVSTDTPVGQFTLHILAHPET